MTQLNPYLNFHGRAREAMEFYHSVLGGELTSNTFADFQMPGIAEDEVNNIMHSQITTPGGLTLMASDVPASIPLPDQSFITVSLSGSDETELRGYWDGLSAGAEIAMPLEAAPWGDAFGQLTDKFGVSWLVNIAGQGNQSPGQGSGTAEDAAPGEI